MTTTASRVPGVVTTAVEALKADSALQTLLGGEKAFTNIKKGTQAPYALVMGGDEVPWAEGFEDDGQDAQGRQCDVIVQCTSTYTGSSEVDDIASRVMEVLLENAVWAAVDGFQVVQFVRNAGLPPQDLAADGTLWFIRLVTIRVSLS